MKPAPLLLLAALALVGCAPPDAPAEAGSLKDARAGFRTKLVRRESAREPVAEPPESVFRVVEYPSPAGKFAAYLTPDAGDGKKLPAIVWMTGGDCNTIGDVWSPPRPGNDQTASAFRKAGLVMMFPSLRGGNRNPGFKEGFLGEVDDVIAAADFLARQPHVDPKRIYLGGHSTGGTLVLLVAASSDKFRATFSFGPVAEVAGYGPEFLPFDTRNPRELALRSPARWLGSVRTPTFVIEGANEGNTDDLEAMRRRNTNANVHFFAVPGATHFSVLGPANALIAEKVTRDTGEKCGIQITDAELRRGFGR